MILLEGVKPQYAVILPGLHAEAIITHPFNVSRGARPRLQPVFSRVSLALSSYLPHGHLPSPTFSRTILRMASSRPGRITWLVAKRCTRVIGAGTCGKGAPEPIHPRSHPTFTIIVRPSHRQIVYGVYGKLNSPTSGRPGTNSLACAFAPPSRVIMSFVMRYIAQPEALVALYVLKNNVLQFSN